MVMRDKCEKKAEETAMCASMYHLSADCFLWGRALVAVDGEQIYFSKICIHGVDLEGYVLFYMAHDLYRRTQHITLSELTDAELISDRAFEWIITTYLIRRYRSAVLQEEGLFR